MNTENKTFDLIFNDENNSNKKGAIRISEAEIERLKKGE